MQRETPMNHFAALPHSAKPAPFAVWLLAMAVGTGFVATLAFKPATIAGRATVHDGDTIRVAGRSIRLHGIVAKLALIEIIGNHQLNCQDYGERSYNRIVATCYLDDGTDIQASLVARGAVLDCARYSHGAYRALEPADARARLLAKPYC
jgi:endonuclease YncB( thermonuclease family)